MLVDGFEFLRQNKGLEAILDFLPYPFLISEFRAGLYYNTYVNKRFVEEIGYQCSEMPTIEDWFNLAYPDDDYRMDVVMKWSQETEAAQRKGLDSVVMQVCIRTKSNGDRWYEVKSSLSGPYQWVAFVSVQELVMRELKLQQLTETQTRTLSILAHDVRVPVSNLFTISQLMLRGDMSMSEFLDRLESIHQRSGQVLDFIDTTLLWTRSNFDKLNIRREPFNIEETVNQMIQLYEGAYRQKNIGIELAMEKKIIQSDKELVTIIMRNLLSNAIKYSNENGFIRIGCCGQNNGCELSVSDTGVGMSAETLKSIIEENNRSFPGTKEEKGLGLGLKLCNQLVKKINGKLKIESQPNKGTTVTLIL